MSDTDIINIYTDDIIALSEKTRQPKRLDNPDASARCVSPICGSVVTVDLKLNDGKISAIGWEVESCALGRYVMAVLAENAAGKTRKDLQIMAQNLEALLETGENKFTGTDFEKLGAMAPVRDYPARHHAVFLPFAAVLKF